MEGRQRRQEVVRSWEEYTWKDLIKYNYVVKTVGMLWLDCQGYTCVHSRSVWLLVYHEMCYYHVFPIWNLVGGSNIGSWISIGDLVYLDIDQ